MANFWGVDSATPATKESYSCVLNELGKPAFWGRYLTTVSGAAEGLTATEIKFLHGKGTKILPIYNKFEASVGYEKGAVSGQNAVYYARRLDVPKGTPIFANVERFFEVDSEWVRGWFDALYKSPYLPGFYFDGSKGNFMEAFCQAMEKETNMKTSTVLWSAQPEVGGTSAQTAPAFKPVEPPCGGNVWAWQYGRDIKECPVDTNLATPQLHSKLW